MGAGDLPAGRSRLRNYLGAGAGMTLRIVAVVRGRKR